MSTEEQQPNESQIPSFPETPTVPLEVGSPSGDSADSERTTDIPTTSDYQVLQELSDEDEAWLEMDPDLEAVYDQAEQARPNYQFQEGQVANAEGAPAYLRDLKEQTVQALTTNLLASTFYASKAEITTQTLETLSKMRDVDPEFLAKALIYGRNEGYLQEAPITGLAVLSTAADKGPFQKAFGRIIQTPDNLMKFVARVKDGTIRQGLGGVASRAVKGWFQGFSEYHALKYSGNSPSVMEGGTVVTNNFSLRDTILLARPAAADVAVNERLGWLVGRHHDLDKLQNNPQITAFEQLKRAETDPERLQLIEAGRLPWEVVIPAVPKMTPELWQALMKQMPYMALLRNINTLERQGLLANDEVVSYLVSRLTDPAAIAKSKILPFRFYEAYRAYSESRERASGRRSRRGQSDPSDESQPAARLPDSRISAALEAALEASFVNLPDLPGTIAIGSDVSGSMSSPISEKGATRYIDICGVFTGALLKKATGRAMALPFQHEVINLSLSGQDRILKTAEELAWIGGGGTAVGAPIKYLLDNNISIDTFIGITDGEDWAYGGDHYADGSFLTLWREYRERFPNAQAYLVTIAPYQEQMAPQEEPGVHYIYGWSDQVPGYIAKSIQGQASQVAAVEAIEL